MADKPILHHNCTILRTKQVKHYTWNLETGEEKFVREETVTEPCNTPLFKEGEWRTGVCSGCRQGLEGDSNRFANEAEKAKAVRTEERQEFLTDIIVTAVEGGITYWAEVQKYVVMYKSLGDKHTRAHCQVRDTEGEKQRWHPVDLDVIEAALLRFREPMADLHDDYRKAIVAADIANDGGDIDADLADMIVQVAVLGSVIYG